MFLRPAGSGDRGRGSGMAIARTRIDAGRERRLERMRLGRCIFLLGLGVWGTVLLLVLVL